MSETTEGRDFLGVPPAEVNQQLASRRRWCSECDEGEDYGHDPECSQPPWVSNEREAELVRQAWKAGWNAAHHPLNREAAKG